MGMEFFKRKRQPLLQRGGEHFLCGCARPEAVRWDSPSVLCGTNRLGRRRRAARVMAAGLGRSRCGCRRGDSASHSPSLRPGFPVWEGRCCPPHRSSGSPGRGRELQVTARSAPGRLDSDGPADSRRAQRGPRAPAGASRGQPSPAKMPTPCQPPDSSASHTLPPPASQVPPGGRGAPARAPLELGTLRPQGESGRPCPGSCHGGVSFGPSRPVLLLSPRVLALRLLFLALYLGRPSRLSTSRSHPPSPRPQVPRSPLGPAAPSGRCPSSAGTGTPESPSPRPPQRPGLRSPGPAPRSPPPAPTPRPGLQAPPSAGPPPSLPLPGRGRRRDARGGGGQGCVTLRRPPAAEPFCAGGGPVGRRPGRRGGCAAGTPSSAQPRSAARPALPCPAAGRARRRIHVRVRTGGAGGAGAGRGRGRSPGPAAWARGRPGGEGLAVLGRTRD